MRTPTLFAVAAAALLAGNAVAQPISYTGSTYNQNFDSLPSAGSNLTWTNGVTLPGWYAFCKNGAGVTGLGNRDPGPWVALSLPVASTLYNAGNGSSASGGIYSFGVTADPNRSFGSVCSGTPDDISYGVVFTNDTASTYTEFTLTYKGRQWRVGGANTYAQQLEFDYKITGSFDPIMMAANSENSSPADPTWTRVTQLDLVNPVTSAAAAGALVGTDAANTVNISYTVTGISWGPGQTLMLRWFDADDTGPGDNGLALDDLQFSTPVVTTFPNLSMVVSDSPDPVLVVGNNLTYTLTVNNFGLAAANGCTITATFPAGVNFSSCSQGGTTFNSQNLTIPLGTIGASGTSGPITLVMTPTVAFPSGSPLSVTFQANPIAGDSDPSNNTRLETTVVDNFVDVVLTNVSDVGGCTTTVGMPITYTVTLNNTGPANATGIVVTDTLPSNTTFNPASNATQGGIVNNNGVVTWTVGNIANGNSATLTLMATIAAPGELANTAAAVSTQPDSNTANNSVVMRNNAPSTDAPIAVLLSTLTGQPSATINVPTGVGPLPYEFSGTTFGLRRPFASPNGRHWVMLADTTATATENSVLIIGDLTHKYVVAREGYDVLDPVELDQVGGSSSTWDQLMLAVNDAGDVAFSINTNHTDTNKNLVAVKAAHPATPGDPYTFSVVARKGGAAAALGGGMTYSTNMSAAGLQADGKMSFYSTIAGGAVEAIFKDDGTTVVARHNTGFPSGQAGGGTFTYDGWLNNTGGRGFSMSEGGSWIADGTINNTDSTANGVLTHDGMVAIQENSVIPGSGFTDGTRINASFNFDYMDGDGHWFAYGANNGSVFSGGQDWVVRDGAVIAKTGDFLTPTSTEKWADNFLARTYFLACGRGNDYCVGGMSSATEGNRRVIVHNGTTIVLREGDPIDINQNGINDDNAYVDLIADNSACIIDDIELGKVLLVVCRVRNSAICSGVTSQGMALLGIHLPPSGPVACSPADLVDGLGNPPGDGFVTGTDADFFVQAYNTLAQRGDGSYYADLCDGFGNEGPDGFVTGTDADFFVIKYFQGC